MLQNDIPPDMVGLCRTDRHTNIGQTNGKTDGIRVSRRRKRLGGSRNVENKLDVAKERCVSCDCSEMGGEGVGTLYMLLFAKKRFHEY